ncbi:hypothetical protein SAMN05518849_11437 [Sphingobium sp. AP50]|uniref:DUF5677 domain-containing protein n=1 Tax=Sphingobium sp. AP50 TaxID=1884369 RepID=UPI0008CAA742|nr:DUF5677 domain-containing protein [Sphingobium sp. AP50]SEJ80620.1 hypothetical protein SAMN05518849_11437 [Sphingobium sp. AP50]
MAEQNAEEGDDPRAALAEEGLLAPTIENWRHDYIEAYAEWFALARDANRYAVWLFQEHQDAGNGGSANDQAPTAVRMFGRAMNAFAAAITLAERAMAMEAAGVARTIYEVRFWLTFLMTKPLEALDALEADTLHNAIAREKLLRGEHHCDAAKAAASHAREAELVKRLAGRKKAPSISEIAKSLPSHTGYLEYRIVSSFYGHLSHNSLDGLWLRGEGGGVRPILGPFETQIPMAISFALDAMLPVVGFFELMINETRFPDRRGEMQDRLHALQSLEMAQ